MIFGFGCLALACTMNNPAFDLERDSDLADETRGTDSTNPDESDDSSESLGDGDGEPSESSSDDATDPTDGDCIAGSSCGPCQICDDDGECVIDVGRQCEGPTLHCADFLFGVSETTCYTLADVALAGRCSEQGACESSLPSECPLEKGVVHFACDAGCVTNLDACTPFSKASEVEMSAMCSVDGEPGPACTPKCTDGIQSLVQSYGCVVGECQPLGAVALCGAYACNEQGTACLEACELISDCAEPFTCVDQQCVQ